METALARFEQQLEVDVRWRPFQLDSSLPRGKGKNKLQAYAEKFGPDMVKRMVPKMKKVGEEVGIRFSYGGDIGNTLDSHRFIWKAREVGGGDLQNKMVDALFAAYFENEGSMGDPVVLKRCAEEAGMPPEVTDRLLSDETIGRAEVAAELREFRVKWNCRGVPLFIVDGKYPMSGAQPAEAFEEVFEDLLS